MASHLRHKKPKPKVGRPSVITPEVLEKLYQAFAIDCTDAEAALYANISVRALYDYQNNNPEFLHRKEALKNTPMLKARGTIVKSLGDVPVAQWYAERKGNFKPKQSVELSGTDGQPIQQAITIQFINAIADEKTDKKLS